MAANPGAALLDGYRQAFSPDGLTCWDEAISPGGRARPAYGDVLRAVGSLSVDEMAARADMLANAYADQGVTFSFSGEERPFPLDPIPRVIDADEWADVERGVQQRVKALEAFLDDLYLRGEALAEGIVPRRLVMTSRHFHRAAYGIRPVRGVRIHVSGIDLIRDEHGRFRVLEDNVRTPSGVSYVIENRQAMTRVFPDLFGSLPIRSVDDYPARLLAALQATAPAVDDPVVVVLTPGVFNSAYVEHTLLARAMGVELVEGRDLVVRDGVVFMRTTDGERRVDVIYRRIDDDFLDPVHFRADSALGVPGMLGAARFGSVTIANGVGNGVADDKLLYSYVPDLIRYYLNEEPVLGNVDTFRLEDSDQRAHVLDRLDEMVLKPVDASGGKGIVIGPRAESAALQRVARDVQRDPRSWIAQPVVQLSTAPTFVDGRLEPRHLDLRPFAVNDGERVWVLPGGLTRVALRRGSLVVNSSQGGGSKDTWVLSGLVSETGTFHPIVLSTPDGTTSDRAARDGAATETTAPVEPLSGLVVGPWEDSAPEQQQQQQQQQVSRPAVAPC
jgi:uncharacterized circularly permuted ATP-grasp superfamily protein